jgi:hypothetical protein
MNDNEPQVNVPLLRKVYEWAETQSQLPATERDWFQASWLLAPYYNARRKYGPNVALAMSQEELNKCGSAFCIAGYTCEINGVIDADSYDIHQTTTGEKVWDYARQQLGLTEEESEELFSGGNDINNVRRIVGQIMERAGERL